MDENEEYFQRQASHRQSRRRFRKINQKGERQTIIDTVDPYPTGKPPIARGYHTVSSAPSVLQFCIYPCCSGLLCAPEAAQCCSVAVLCSVCVLCFLFFFRTCCAVLLQIAAENVSLQFTQLCFWWPQLTLVCWWLCFDVLFPG